MTSLHIEADLQADVIHTQVRSPFAARPTCPQWDIVEASLTIQGDKVIIYMKAHLTSQMYDHDLLSCLLTKKNWSP
jgi:hypothetical protein